MTRIIEDSPDPPPGTVLHINPEKVCHIIVKARAFDVKDEVSDPDSGSNATDDGMTDVLEDHSDDATYQELIAFIRALDEEERAHLIALAWLGRGTYDIAEWRQALEDARAEHGRRAAEYLTGLPMLGDYLEEGLAAFGESCGASDAASIEREAMDQGAKDLS